MKITNIQYVRNGSGCCEGFTQVFFSNGRNLKNMMAILFGYHQELPADQVAVINLDDPTLKWDASDFLPQIREAIATWEASWDASQAKYTVKFPFTVK